MIILKSKSGVIYSAFYVVYYAQKLLFYSGTLVVVKAVTPEKKIASTADEHAYVLGRITEQITEHQGMHSMQDWDDILTIIRLELHEYEQFAPSILLVKAFQISSHDEKSWIAHLSTSKQLEEDISVLVHEHGIKNALTVLHACNGLLHRKGVHILTYVVCELFKRELSTYVKNET